MNCKKFILSTYAEGRGTVYWEDTVGWHTERNRATHFDIVGVKEQLNYFNKYYKHIFKIQTIDGKDSLLVML